jgi:hypothetical protein
MAKTLILPPGIGSYVTVIEPKPDQQGKLKYSITVLVDKARANELNPLRAAVLEVATLKWGAKAAQILKAAKYPVIKDGDEKIDENGVIDPIYKGKLYFSAKSDRKPMVIDANKNELFTDDDIYSGCLVRISANPYCYDYQGNKGVSLGLNNVQMLKKGNRLDGRKSATDEFSEWVDPQGVTDDVMA